MTMLVIRKEQMEIFQKQAVERFVDRIALWLREDYYRETSSMNNTELRSLIHLGIERAKEYGIEMEYDVGCYIGFMVKYGIDFDKLFWAKPYFFQRPLPYPTATMHILARTKDSDFQEDYEEI